jgi:hypothetical protein
MTITTIGYGDIIPQTVAERIYVTMCMLTGARNDVGISGQEGVGWGLVRPQPTWEYVAWRRFHKNQCPFTTVLIP